MKLKYGNIEYIMYICPSSKLYILLCKCTIFINANHIGGTITATVSSLSLHLSY